MSEATLRKRKWFIEINKGASCYDEVEALCVNYQYALIKHDKDSDELGKIREEHKHLYIESTNPINFTTLQNKFKGAHIEVALNRTYCIQYLIHRNNKEKYQYQPSEVNTNIVDIDTILNAPYYEPFDPNHILTYIEEGCTSYIKFYKRFGAYIQNYTILINNVLRGLDTETLQKGWLWNCPLDLLLNIANKRLKLNVERIETEQAEKNII